MLGFVSTEHTVDCVSIQAQSACGEDELLGRLTVELQNAVEVHRSDRLPRPSCAAPHNQGSSSVVVHSRCMYSVDGVVQQGMTMACVSFQVVSISMKKTCKYVGGISVKGKGFF